MVLKFTIQQVFSSQKMPITEKASINPLIFIQKLSFFLKVNKRL